jgi:hypothetical protein
MRAGRRSTTLRWGAIVTGAIVASVALDAQRAKPAGPFANAKAFACSFPVYGAAKWGAAPEPINGTQEFTYRIEGIDYRRNQARVVGSAAVPVTLRLGETGLNVIEQTPIGNFILTTVFSAGGDGKTFRAAHSRHLGELNEAPRTSQSYGTCELE